MKITLDKLKEMRLHGMHRGLQTSIETRAEHTADELIAYLTEAEWDERQTRKINRHIKNARFRYQASAEHLDFAASRNMDKNIILRLCSGSFIDSQENVIITGATGTGKSYLASAIGHQACTQGYKVLYARASKLFAQLNMARADGSYHRELSRIFRNDLLIIDDFGIHPIDRHARLALLEIIEEMHGRRSTIIATQLPVSAWHELLEEQTIADAILDRIIHSAHRIELKGESMRKKKAAQSAGTLKQKNKT